MLDRRSKSWTCPTCASSNAELLPVAEPKLDKGKGRAEETAVPETDGNSAEPVLPSERPAQSDDPAMPVDAPTSQAESVAMPVTPPRRQVTALPPHHSLLASTAVSPDPSTASEHAQENRPVQVMDLLSAQLGGLGPAHQPRAVPHAVALTAVGPNSAHREGNSPPPVWLDGAIGLVLVALASLLCRKVM